MDYTTLFVVVAAIAAVFIFKRVGQLSSGRAVELLKAGARIVDVRSEAEFRADHLEGALNLPLDELASRASTELADKNAPVLVHCLSGGRSLMAARQLRGLGYTNAHNIGSIGRARSLQRRSQKP